MLQILSASTSILQQPPPPFWMFDKGLIGVKRARVPLYTALSRPGCGAGLWIRVFGCKKLGSGSHLY